MHVLFLSSHPFGAYALDYLKSCEGWDDISVKVAGRLDPYPESYDLGVSFLYNFRIPAPELTPNRKWINFHPAPLPAYRGRNVAYHAIMNGELEFGATLHYVAPAFDTGDIIDMLTFPLLSIYNAGDVAQLARERCLELFKRYIPDFLNQKPIMAYPQGQGTYYRKENINEFIGLSPYQEKLVRAITAELHYAKVKIAGRIYEFRPTEQTVG